MSAPTHVTLTLCGVEHTQVPLEWIERQLASQGLRVITEAAGHALDELHVWLHSPGGDCNLIDACQDWHESLDAAECNKLELEHSDRPVRIEVDIPRNVVPLHPLAATLAAAITDRCYVDEHEEEL